MVLRIKEREEAIQLLAMDPQVCGKLLMLHRKGIGVDVDALHGGIPLRQSTGKGLQMGSRKNRRLRQRKSGFDGCSNVFGIYENIQAEEIGRWTLQGQQGWGRALLAGRTLCPCGCVAAPLTCTPSPSGVFWSKKNLREVLFHLDSV